MPETTIKDEARRLVERLPEDATWEDLQYEIYFRPAPVRDRTVVNVRWAEAALADLQAVEAYIARHSEQYARAKVERIFERSELLATQSRLGPVVPEYEDETLRELFVDPYRIVYRLLDDQPDIVAVAWCTGRDGGVAVSEPLRMTPFSQSGSASAGHEAQPTVLLTRGLRRLRRLTYPTASRSMVVMSARFPWRACSHEGASKKSAKPHREIS